MHTNRNNLVALAHALLGAAAIIASIMTIGQIRIPEQPVKGIGLVVFFLGASLFAYALGYLRKAFLGEVDPLGDSLVRAGPYRVVRHPVYLAMLVMTTGLAIVVRSVLGLALNVFAFLPAAVYRARLEERALEAKHGDEWRAYRDRTRFLIPGIY